LEAREQLKELRSSYAWHAVRRERDRVAALFAPDGVFELKVGDDRVRLIAPVDEAAFASGFQ